MMDLYPTYKAKTRLREILRQVRSGRTIRLAHRGEPIAEIRPIDPNPEGWEDRVRELTERGVLVCSTRPQSKLLPIPRKPGALNRFLAEQNK